jgi:hypothetical protein
MGRVFRTLLAWLLLLVVPLHGLAAARMSGCHSGSGLPTAQAAHPDQPPGLEAVRHQDRHHGAHHSADHSAHLKTPASLPIAPDGGVGDAPVAGSHPCPACLACAHALALPAAGLPAVAAGPAMSSPALAAVWWPERFGPLPDKPPRA